MPWFHALFGALKNRRRPQSRARLGIENLEARCLMAAALDANATFIQNIYHDDLGRAASNTEVNYWQSVLVSQGTGVVVQEIEHSPEARDFFVQRLYANFLDRATVPGEDAFFVQELLTGASEEQVTAQFLASPEFFQHTSQLDELTGAPSDAAFYQAVYQGVLDRQPTETELENVLLTPGWRENRLGFVEDLISSEQFRTHVVTQFYGSDDTLGVLHRAAAPSDAEVSYWANSSMSLGDIHIALESSVEEFRLGEQGMDANQRFIQTVYADALGRTASASELDFWEQKLLEKGSATVVTGIQGSFEAQMHLVKNWYIHLLSRPAADVEAAFFARQLANGASREQVLGEIFGADGYALHAVQTLGDARTSDETFIRSLYLQLLNRDASADDVSYFTIKVLPAAGRAGAARLILNSPEFRAEQVREFYRAILQRPGGPTAAEVNFWVNSGLSLESIQTTFEASVEHFTAPLREVTLGDSITDEYGKFATQPADYPWGANGDRNWVEQLGMLRGTNITMSNEALQGATSASLLVEGQHGSEGQPVTAATLIHAGDVDNAVVIIGANDVKNWFQASLGQVLAKYQQTGTLDLSLFDARPMITTLVGNLQATLDTLQAAGTVHVVVANVPDFSVTPRFTDPQLAPFAPVIKAAVQAANQQIEALAAARGLPVLDLFALSGLPASHPVLGGVTVPNGKFFAPDGFHPGTVLQGLLANTVLEAEHRAYGLSVDGLKLTDQEILTEAGISHPEGVSYFDVSQFVIYSPASAVVANTLFVAA